MAKPELTLMKFTSSFDEIVKASEHMMGRKCTPEELEEAKQAFKKLEATRSK